MRRREFITLLGGAAVAWPLAPHAQQSGKVPTIGILTIRTTTGGPLVLVDAFRQGLRDLGLIEGRNVVVEIAVAPTLDRLPELAAELVRMKVDVIFASSSTFVEAARQATKTISAHNDPVGVGHVASLAHPGGNITGLSQVQTELAAKELEMLKEAVPQATRIGVLWNPTTPSHLPALKSIEAAAEKLGVQLQMVPAQSADELEGALSTMAEARAGAFLVVGSPSLTSRAIGWRRSL